MKTPTINKNKKRTSLKMPLLNSKLRGGNQLSKAETLLKTQPFQFPTMGLNNMKGKKAVSTSFFKNPILYLHEHIMFLNNSKFFAGVVMILLNIGSKFISVEFSKSTEEYLKYTMSKQILVFAMAWMASRDIYTALVLTAVFVILSEHLFNEDSTFCIVPHKNRVLNKKLLDVIDTDNSGLVSEKELNDAIKVLEKAKVEKQIQSNNKK